MINYTIKVNQLTCVVNNPERPNDVKNVQVLVTAHDTENNVSHGRWCVFWFNPSDSFINFDDLTESDVVSWVESHEFYPVLQAELADEVSRLVNPVEVSKTPPWLIPEPVNTATTATVTGTTVQLTGRSVDVQEVYLRSLIYQILDEINSTTV